MREQGIKKRKTLSAFPASKVFLFPLYCFSVSYTCPGYIFRSLLFFAEESWHYKNPQTIGRTDDGAEIWKTVQTFARAANVLKRTRVRDIPQINPAHENILYV